MGALDLGSSLIDMASSVADKIWPDPVKKSEEMRKLEELRQNGQLEELNAQVKILLAQIEVNKEEAKSASLFVSGARPFIIWAGGFAMAWAGIFHPILTWVWAFSQMPGDPPPVIDGSALTAVVSGLLGVSTMRSFDKTKGTSKDSLK